MSVGKKKRGNYIGLGVASVGILIDLFYFGFEYIELGGGKMAEHFIEELPEHLVISSMIILFPLLGYILTLHLNQRDIYERQLEEQTELTSGIFQTVGVPIFTLNRDYRLEDMNKSGKELFSFREGDGQKLFSHPQDLWDIVDRVNKEGTYEGEVYLQGREGPIPTHMSVRSLKDSRGGLKAYIFAARNISAEKEKEDLKKRMFQAEKLASVGDLAGGIAHEINNPLTTVSLTTEKLMEEYYGDDRLRGKLQKIKGKVDRASDIAREMLSICQPYKQDIDNLQLEELVQSALDTLEVPEGVKVNIDVGEIELMADEVQMRRVLINLILNSIQAMPEGGELNINAWKMDGKVIIEIADTGEGISREVEDKIFDPFFSTREVGIGTGLGLSVAHSIISSHHGKIEVESERGKGTTFTLTLPFNPKEKSHLYITKT